jgi:hypothetical protein
VKKKLKSHSSHIGPAISLDLADISVIEEFGDRNSNAGWVRASITLKYGKVIDIKLGITDMKQLVLDWEGLNGG